MPFDTGTSDGFSRPFLTTSMLFAVAILHALWPGTALATPPTHEGTASIDVVSLPIKARHLDRSRAEATELPRKEADQAIVEGWPLYRTDRGQQAFNDAMATLWATDGPAPTRAAFKSCPRLSCNLKLPKPSADGWIPAGRIWLSPNEFVLIAHSPRPHTKKRVRRRGSRGMKYFVFHEFNNSSHNADPYDTISAHKGSVFVPFYMSKQAHDAKGHAFVVVVQVAPYDVVSIHATNYGSAGPGIEVAKNSYDTLEPLQGLAGVLVATIVKSVAPRLKVVNHRGVEGLPMLQAYERRIAMLRSQRSASAVELPFVPAQPNRVANATGRLENLVARGAPSRPVPVALRAVVAPSSERSARLVAVIAAAPPALVRGPTLAMRPRLISPPRLARPRQ
jgi:hypothetical protein